MSNEYTHHDPTLSANATVTDEDLPLALAVTSRRLYVLNNDKLTLVATVTYWHGDELRTVNSDGYEVNENGEITRDWRDTERDAPTIDRIREQWNATMNALYEAYPTAAEITDGIYPDRIDGNLLTVAAFNEALVERLSHFGKIRAIESALYRIHGAVIRVRIVLSDIPF